jgi:N utilization substance protein B
VSIIKHLKKVDNLISANAPRYPLKNVSRTDLAILRLSVFDLIIDKKIPEKVIIDEAVILAKELSGERSYAFVNAVLGKILSNTKITK